MLSTNRSTGNKTREVAKTTAVAAVSSGQLLGRWRPSLSRHQCNPFPICKAHSLWKLYPRKESALLGLEWAKETKYDDAHCNSSTQSAEARGSNILSQCAIQWKKPQRPNKQKPPKTLTFNLAPKKRSYPKRNINSCLFYNNFTKYKRPKERTWSHNLQLVCEKKEYTNIQNKSQTQREAANQHNVQQRC